jgi:CRP-like cAMP-binding protein
VRGPGDLVGLTDLTANRPVRAIATAILGDVRALSFRTDDLRETALSRPRLILALMRALGRRVDDLEALLVDMG